MGSIATSPPPLTGETGIERVLWASIVSEYDGEEVPLWNSPTGDEAHQVELSTIHGAYSGQGYVRFDSGAVYTGNFVRGQFNGEGTYLWPDGVRYEGSFRANCIEGQGSLHYPCGSVYTGSLKNGLRHGRGHLKCSTGQEYNGDWVQGKRQGYGLLYYTEDKKRFYNGEWFANQRHGYGRMQFSSGAVYDGEWRHNHKYGFGIMRWTATGEVYTGDWVSDLPHGLGELIWGDAGTQSIRKQCCNMYRGEFVQGKRSGRGTFFFMNGSQFSGEWQADEKVGVGVLIGADGKISAGNFDANRLMLTGESTNLRTEGAKNDILPDDLTPQYRIHVGDVLMHFPIAAVNFSNSTATDRAASREKMCAEIERCLLKYHQFNKSFFKTYLDAARRLRLSHASAIETKSNEAANEILSAPLRPTAEWSRDRYLLSTAHRTRAIHSRFHTPTIAQFLCAARELSLLDEHTNSWDVLQMLNALRSEQQVCAHRQYAKYFRENFSGVPNGDTILGNTMASDLLQIDLLLDDYLHPEQLPEACLTPGMQPLREHEFMDLLVRLILEGHSRRGFDEYFLTPYQVVEKCLATKLLPFVREAIKPEKWRDFHLDTVQELLRGTGSKWIQTPLTRPLKEAWRQVMNIRSPEDAQLENPTLLSSSVQLRDFVAWIETNRLCGDSSTAQIVATLFSKTIAGPVDVSASELVALVSGVSLDKEIGYEDFLQHLCILIQSAFWTGEVISLPEQDTDTPEEASAETTTGDEVAVESAPMPSSASHVQSSLSVLNSLEPALLHFLSKCSFLQ